MNYNPYSVSKIQKFQQCPKAFEYKYITKLKVPFVPSIALVRGVIIHNLLEHHELSLPEKIQKIQSEQEIINNKFYNKDLIKECVQVYNKFVETDIGKEMLGYKKLFTEIGIGLDKTLKSTNYKEGELFRGFIDRISVYTTGVQLDVENDVVHIIDWKTGKDKSSGPYAQAPDQLIYYATWYFEHFPVNTIVVNFVFVEHENAVLKYTLTRENLPKYKKLLLVNINNIEKCEDFVNNEGPLCQWCDYLETCGPSLQVR